MLNGWFGDGILVDLYEEEGWGYKFAMNDWLFFLINSLMLR